MLIFLSIGYAPNSSSSSQPVGLTDATLFFFIASQSGSSIILVVKENDRYNATQPMMKVKFGAKREKGGFLTLSLRSHESFWITITVWSWGSNRKKKKKHNHIPKMRRGEKKNFSNQNYTFISLRSVFLSD